MEVKIAETDIEINKIGKIETEMIETIIKKTTGITIMTAETDLKTIEETEEMTTIRNQDQPDPTQFNEVEATQIIRCLKCWFRISNIRIRFRHTNSSIQFNTTRMRLKNIK